MKKLIFLYFIFILFAFGCESPQYSHIEVYNAFDTPVEFTLNNELQKLDPNVIAYFRSEKRSQLFQFGQTKELIKTKENERFLINLAQDTIIKEELLYGSGNGGGATASGGTIAAKLLKLRGQKYFGPYEVITNKLVIRKFDFCLNEEAPNRITSGEKGFKRGTYFKIWNEYYKLSTIDEFMKRKVSLNNSKEYVLPIINSSSKILNQSATFRMFQQAVFVQMNGKDIGSIAQARVSSNDVIEFFKPSIYNPQKDGSIKETIIKIPNCNIEISETTKKLGVIVDVVLCDKHSDARLVVR